MASLSRSPPEDSLHETQTRNALVVLCPGPHGGGSRCLHRRHGDAVSLDGVDLPRHGRRGRAHLVGTLGARMKAFKKYKLVDSLPASPIQLPRREYAERLMELIANPTAHKDSVRGYITVRRKKAFGRLKTEIYEISGVELIEHYSDFKNHRSVFHLPRDKARVEFFVLDYRVVIGNWNFATSREILGCKFEVGDIMHPSYTASV